MPSRCRAWRQDCRQQWSCTCRAKQRHAKGDHRKTQRGGHGCARRRGRARGRRAWPLYRAARIPFRRGAARPAQGRDREVVADHQGGGHQGRVRPGYGRSVSDLARMRSAAMSALAPRAPLVGGAFGRCRIGVLESIRHLLGGRTGGPSRFSATSQLFASWKSWCDERNLKPGSDNSLSDALVDRGFIRKEGTGGVRGFRGLTVRDLNASASSRG
jgi:hypothetical protein